MSENLSDLQTEVSCVEGDTRRLTHQVVNLTARISDLEMLLAVAVKQNSEFATTLGKALLARDIEKAATTAEVLQKRLDKLAEIKAPEVILENNRHDLANIKSYQSMLLDDSPEVYLNRCLKAYRDSQWHLLFDASGHFVVGEDEFEAFTTDPDLSDVFVSGLTPSVRELTEPESE